MKLTLGFDVGTVSAKWALLGPRDRIEKLKSAADGLVDRIHPYPHDAEKVIAVSRYRRVQGKPLDVVVRQIGELFDHITPDELAGVMITVSSTVPTLDPWSSDS